MKIFYGEKENVDYSNCKKYAFLNWCFDDGCGKNSNPNQHISDNFILGKAFIGNAILTLNNIFEQGNILFVADKLIFPVLFNAWHGVELWLKSSISALSWLLSKNTNRKKGHKIDDLFGILIKMINDYKVDWITSIALITVEEFINEFKKVNAHFDFARYSFDTRKNYQFYNAPYGSNKQWQISNNSFEKGKVPNTCVDLLCLFETLVKVFEEFGTFVEYLDICIHESEDISYEHYDSYLKSCKKCEELFGEHDSKEEKDVNAIIMETIS